MHVDDETFHPHDLEVSEWIGRAYLPVSLTFLLEQVNSLGTERKERV